MLPKPGVPRRPAAAPSHRAPGGGLAPPPRSSFASQGGALAVGALGLAAARGLRTRRAATRRRAAEGEGLILPRRSALGAAGGSLLAAGSGPAFGEVVAEEGSLMGKAAGRPRPAKATNQVLETVDGIRRKRLGGGDIVVSELALGTQRWYSSDFNAPNEAQCQAFMDRAILGSGVNLIDTAEQYPIPSDDRRPEGFTEEAIGRWMAKDQGRRRNVVLATKITGGFNVTKENIQADCEGSLKRLGTDYIDVYQLHWPARYSPQANWGQSLTYQFGQEDAGYMDGASFEEICLAMDKLRKEGKIRGWGLCNDNAFGLTACCETARRLGVAPPVSLQGDYSLLDRKSEENGVFEASSPVNENVGFMAYNALAGGCLTGKYLDEPAAVDQSSEAKARKRLAEPRGRMDEVSWGLTLYRYRTDAAQRATAAYARLAKKFNMSPTELSLRWCRERRGLTTVLLGTSSMQQLEEDLRCFQTTERLPRELMWEIDRVHMINRLPLFSSEKTASDWNGVGEIGEAVP